MKHGLWSLKKILSNGNILDLCTAGSNDADTKMQSILDCPLDYVGGGVST